ncbi:MAG: cell surface protein [Alistipes sp.]|nr:cell surface protein [Alistipes sp.]
MTRLACLTGLLAVAMMSSCNKDGIITADNPPRILLDDASGVYTVKIGRELEITPRYEYADNATFRWTQEGRVIGTEPALLYRAENTGTAFVRIEVTAAGGSASEELRIEAVELEIPIVALPEAGKEHTIAIGSELLLSPVVSRTSIPAHYAWSVDGQEVASEESYTFRSDAAGSFRVCFTASNDDGQTSAELTVRVCEPDELPFAWTFATTEHRMAAGRTIRLSPLDISRTQGVVFTWTEEGTVLQESAEPALCFTSSEQGMHTLVVTASGSSGEEAFSLSQEVSVEVCAPEGTYRRPCTASSSAAATRVFEFLPAPGQFINENYTVATMDEACAWAEGQLSKGSAFISLGAFGGRIVVGFDHSVGCSGGYDLSIGGNSFASSSEPGIVFVMQDENGDGLPNDTWYELKGSEYGKPSTWQEYAVTYYRPAAGSMDIAWRDNRGGSGTVDRLNFHTQDSYYPAWVESDSYTLRGTRLEARNYFDGLEWINPPYDWGYADNFSATDRPDGGSNAEGGVSDNRFRIADAVRFDGRPADLQYIDFVMVQTGVQAQSGTLGEISTEISGFRDCNLQ